MDNKVILTTSEEIQKINTKLDSVTNRLDDLNKNFQPKEPEEYLTRHEVAAMFKIDISSVHNWTKRGKIKSYGVQGSGRVYYKRSEIEKVLVQL